MTDQPATPESAESSVREHARHARYLLVGGGLAAATAAETLRQEGAQGAIVMVADERDPPYHRPQLSTRFLEGDAAPPLATVLPPDYFHDHGVTLLSGVRATGLDADAQLVHTDHAGVIRYERLLVATGVRPVHLDVPGAALPGIHYLRTAVDARTLRGAMEGAARAVVVGAGFIALEMAAAFARKGVRVTVLARHGMLFDKLQDHGISDYLRALYVGQGVEVLADTVAAFHGERRVEMVVTEGGRRLPCELVGVGIGVAPDLGWLEGSALALDDGVCVDQYLQASHPLVWAAGDVANFVDPVFRLRHRIEHWDNAVKQGRLAARNMLGMRLRYDEVPYFSCELFGQGFQFLGLPEAGHHHARLGRPETRSWACLYLDHDVPRALFSTGRPAVETRAIESLIRYRTNIGWACKRLDEPDFCITRIPSQTALILQGGGALGAFECGVAHALEAAGIQPDVIAGVSIGAFNGVIMAANPGRAAAALEDFWRRLAVDLPLDLGSDLQPGLRPDPPLQPPPERPFDLPHAAGTLLDDRARRLLGSWQTLAFGVPAFFRPRWTGMPFLGTSPLDWTSLYDPTPVKELLMRYVDFGALKASPVRLLVSAVNVETARLEIFDSYVDDLSADHILASGSLPPGFPWTTIDGKHYWDGGIISNSPLELLLEHSGTARKRIFIVDLYPETGALPTNLMEVLGRRDEIVFAERIRRDSAEQSLVRDFRKLVEGILDYATSPAQADQVRQWPTYIQLMGDKDAAPSITRIMRKGSECETAARDFDFSALSIARHMAEGQAAAREALAARRGAG
ncbi:NADPH-dependent 2,4-dienoyl-CoA reductase/sulfur reductase-like enzyme/predicted acylesterase/phospholipase RssA [Massilia sp. UYP11]|uniref:FAD-dependent oxidoreductase n=1 Tax=Massilia sp. UYP11 TaxID=1756385 RepID=UPI003D1D8D73